MKGGAPDERPDGDKWAQIRNAQENGTLDELQANVAAKIQALLVEKQTALQEMQLIQPGLNPSHWREEASPIQQPLTPSY